MLSMLALVVIWLIQGIVFKITWHYVTDTASKKFWTYYAIINIIVASLALTGAVFLFKENNYQTAIGIFMIAAVGHVVFFGLLAGTVEYFKLKDETPVKATSKPQPFKECACWGCQTDQEHDSWLDKFRVTKEC